jgi:hypothetical protein
MVLTSLTHPLCTANSLTSANLYSYLNVTKSHTFNTPLAQMECAIWNRDKYTRHKPVQSTALTCRPLPASHIKLQSAMKSPCQAHQTAVRNEEPLPRLWKTCFPELCPPCNLEQDKPCFYQLVLTIRATIQRVPQRSQNYLLQQRNP